MTRVFLVAILVMLCISGCEGPDASSEVMTFHDLAGTYVANFGSARINEIIIRSDSTFSHIYVPEDGPRVVNEGRFEFVDLGRHKYRFRTEHFKDLVPPTEACIDETSADDSTYAVSFRIRRSGTRQILEYCPSQFKYYVKALD